MQTHTLVRKVLRCSLFACCALVLPIQTAWSADPSNTLEKLFKTMTPICSEMATSMPVKIGMAEMIKVRPVDSVAVCVCADARFRSDAGIRDLSNLSPDQLVTRLNSEGMQDYIAARFVQSALACLVPELDAVLSANKPGR